MLLNIAVDIACAYTNTSSGLTEVPSDIPSSDTSVNLGNNAISNLDGRLDHMTDLKKLLVKGNNFVTFPNLVMICGTLKVLDVGRNDISEIDPALLIPCVMLTELYIAENKLATFPDLSPVGNTLQRLSLSRNDIASAPATHIDPLTKLKYLTIYRNLLSELPDFTGPASSLTKLKLYDNPIQIVGLKEMQVLNGIIDVDLRNTLFISLPPVCYDKPTGLDLEGSSLDLCVCDSVWLKKEEEKGNLNLVVTDVTCPDATKPWTQMTHEELESVCQGIYNDCSKGKTFIF